MTPPTVIAIGGWALLSLALVGGCKLQQHRSETAVGVNESVDAFVDGYQLVAAQEQGWEFEQVGENETDAQEVRNQ